MQDDRKVTPPSEIPPDEDNSALEDGLGSDDDVAPEKPDGLEDA